VSEVNAQSPVSQSTETNTGTNTGTVLNREPDIHSIDYAVSRLLKEPEEATQEEESEDTAELEVEQDDESEAQTSEEDEGEEMETPEDSTEEEGE